MISIPLFSFTKVITDENHEGRTSGGYTFVSEEHPRGQGGKFDDNGGPKPYVKENGRVSKTSEKRVKESTRKTQVKKEELVVKKPAKVTLEQQNASYKKWEESYAKREPERAEILRKDLSHFEHIDLLSRQDIVALRTYQEDSDYVQKYLAFGEKPKELLDEDVEADIKRISKSIKTFEVKEDFHVFRGLSPLTSLHSSDQRKASQDYIESFLNATKGEVIENKAFTSGSIDFSAARHFQSQGRDEGILLGIQLKKGQHALPMNFISDKILSEREVLLDKNSKFKVEEVSKEQRYIFVSLIEDKKS